MASPDANVASTTTTASSTTRWQAMRHRHPLQYRSLRTLRFLITATLIMSLYSFLLIGFQPDRSFPAVIRENERNRLDYQRRWKAQVEEDKKRRSKEMEELRRVQQDEKQQSNNQTSSTTTSNDNESFINTSNASSLSPTTETRHEEEKSAFQKFFFVFSAFLESFLCFAFLRGLSRMAIEAVQRHNPRYARTRALNFQTWMTRLNQIRQGRGERPLSAESLRLVLQDRDLDGNDYENLWAFHEEAGSATTNTTRGATIQEIRQFPHRILGSGDDLLRTSMSSTNALRNPTPCPICLEAYRLHDTVRTIPCFHTFHTKCIDPWLVRKATCPICKHSAVP